MTVEALVRISVCEREAALKWYNRLRSGTAFHPNELEAMPGGGRAPRQLHRGATRARRAPQADLLFRGPNERIAAIADQGIEPFGREASNNGVHHVIYRDSADMGIRFASAPLEEPA